MLCGPNEDNCKNHGWLCRESNMSSFTFSPDINYEDRLFFVLDGTSLVISNPKNHTSSRSMYVHYKKHTGYRYFIACTRDGTIVYCSPLFPGVVPDDTLYKEVKMSEMLTEKIWF